jgi:hypothetical protein
VGNLRERNTWKTKRGWEDNIKINIQEVDRVLDSTDLAKSRNRWLAFVNAVMKLRVP